MKWSQFYWTALIVLIILEGLPTDGASDSHSDDMLKTLWELDRMYAGVARPSLRSGSSNPPRPSFTEPKVQRAINMLKLQNLDRLYAEKSRPRFGKRGNDNFQSLEYEGQDYKPKDFSNEWLPIRR